MASKFARFESSWLQHVGILQEKVYKTRITDLDELKQRLRTEWTDRAGSHRHCSSHSPVASSIAADQWHMCCIPLLQYFPHAVINWFKSGEFGCHSWGGINSGVSLSNNSTVERARWACQVSQGSVEILFRWGGKRLHDFVANLFEKLCTKFHHNCPSFTAILQKYFGLFFPDTVHFSFESLLFLHRLALCWNICKSKAANSCE